MTAQMGDSITYQGLTIERQVDMEFLFGSSTREEGFDKSE